MHIANARLTLDFVRGVLSGDWTSFQIWPPTCSDSINLHFSDMQETFSTASITLVKNVGPEASRTRGIIETSGSRSQDRSDISDETPDVQDANMPRAVLKSGQSKEGSASRFTRLGNTSRSVVQPSPLTTDFMPMVLLSCVLLHNYTALTAFRKMTTDQPKISSPTLSGFMRFPASTIARSSMSPSCAAHVGTDALSDRYGSPKKSNFLFTERTLQMDKFMSNHRLAEDLKWPSFGDDTSIARANLHCKWSQTGSKQVLSADSPLPIGLKPSDPTGLTATDQEQELCLVVFGQDLMFHFAQGGMWEPSVSDDGQFISLDLLPGSELQEVLQGYRGKGGLTRITLWRQSLPQFNPPVLPFEGSDDVTVEHCLAWFQASQSSCEEQAVITAPYEDLKVPQDLIESISSDNQTW